MGNKTDRFAGVANQAAGKVKESVGRATGSKELEVQGLAQEAKGKAESLRSDVAPAVKRSLHDHTISVVTAVKSWT